MIYLLALLIGVVAGLRAMMPLAAVSWAAHLGVLPLQGTWLAFLGYSFVPYIFTVIAIVELVTDQLPGTPSRKVPVQFGARIVTGGFAGAAIGLGGGSPVAGLIAGVIGAVIGTFAGAAVRARLAGTFGRDLPAALAEDAVAVIASAVAVAAL